MWKDLVKDEQVNMAQFASRRSFEVEEKRDSKFKRTLSMFADAMVCHNGLKFKWSLRPPLVEC